MVTIRTQVEDTLDRLLCGDIDLPEATDEIMEVLDRARGEMFHVLLATEEDHDGAEWRTTMPEPTLAQKAEKLARRWSKRAHGTEGLWQLYLGDAYFEITGRPSIRGRTTTIHMKEDHDEQG